jgi:hypothetical protein
MRAGDLDLGLLYRIMERLGELRERGNSVWAPISTADCMDLVRGDGVTGTQSLDRLLLHVGFLRDVGLVKIPGQAGVHTKLQLTGKGQIFVQPELAEFGQQPILPQVVKSLEDQLQILTYPQEEKDGMLYRLRDAVSKQAPDLIAKVIAEISVKLIAGK